MSMITASSRGVRVALIAGALACAALAGARLVHSEEPERPRSIALTLRATTQATAPVARARFWVNGRDVGVTNASGVLTFTFDRAVNMKDMKDMNVAITIACPPGYRGPSKPRALPLSHLMQGAGPHDKPVPVATTSICEPELRMAALIVRAQAGARPARLPILVNGELVSQTATDGTAHVLLRVPVQDSVRVTLDTSQQPRLAPQNPTRTFASEDQHLLLFDQHFERTRPPGPRPRARPADERVQRIPYEIR